MVKKEERSEVESGTSPPRVQVVGTSFPTRRFDLEIRPFLSHSSYKRMFLYIGATLSSCFSSFPLLPQLASSCYPRLCCLRRLLSYSFILLLLVFTVCTLFFDIFVFKWRLNVAPLTRQDERKRARRRGQKRKGFRDRKTISQNHCFEFVEFSVLGSFIKTVTFLH